MMPWRPVDDDFHQPRWVLRACLAVQCAQPAAVSWRRVTAQTQTPSSIRNSMSQPLAAWKWAPWSQPGSLFNRGYSYDHAGNVAFITNTLEF